MKKTFLLSIMLLVAFYSYATELKPYPLALPDMVVDDIKVWVTRTCPSNANGKIDLVINNSEGLYSVKYIKPGEQGTIEIVKEVLDFFTVKILKTVQKMLLLEDIPMG